MSKPFITKVIADFRVTLPKDQREEFQIEEGDFVEIQIVRKITTEA